MNNKLIDFLRRMPWASRELLENYFEAEDLGMDLLLFLKKTTSITRADNQTYYSAKPTNYHLLPGISRREMVRKFMPEKYGYAIFDEAESPCGNADFRVFLEDSETWIRVWGDMGHIAPECLLIFRNPPVFGDNVRDIIRFHNVTTFEKE